jgi:hypothetical protein
METTLIILCDLGTKQVASLFFSFFGDDAPIFDDEVEVPYRDMFNMVDEMIPPETVSRLDDCYVVCAWTCELEDVEDYCKDFQRAGILKIAAYVWADELEKYVVFEGARLVVRAPVANAQSQKMVQKLNSEWGDEDKPIVANLISLLG